MMEMNYCFTVTGMHGYCCEGHVESAVKQYLDTHSHISIKSPVASFNDKSLTLLVEDASNGLTPVDLCDFLNADIFAGTGFSCSLADNIAETSKSERAATQKKQLLQGTIGVLSGGVIMLLLMFTPGLSVIYTAAIAAISVAMTVALGYESYSTAFAQWRRSKKISMHTLFTISTIAVISLSLAAFYIPALPMMFDVSLLIFGFHHIGRLVTESLKEELNLNKRFQDLAPKTVSVVGRSGQQSLHNVCVGDVIEIGANTVDLCVPLDGKSKNATWIYDTIETGSTKPRAVQVGEPILAGMRVVAGEVLQLEVTANVDKSNLKKLDLQITRAKLSQAPLQLLSDSILQWFVPVVLILAVVSAIFVAYFFNITLAIQCAAAVLVSACPCTLAMIVPLSVSLGMLKARMVAKTPFRNPVDLQMAGEVNYIVIDLNATLTEGKPRVTEVYKFANSSYSLDEILALAATLEHDKKQAVATSIIQYAIKHLSQELRTKFSIEKTDSQPNDPGVVAWIAGKRYIIGNEQFMAAKGIKVTPPTDTTPIDRFVYIACNQELLGRVRLQDKLRVDAIYVLNELQELGIKRCIASGSDRDTVTRYKSYIIEKLQELRKKEVAENRYKSDVVVDIDIQYECSPQTKKYFMQTCVNNGYKVCMLGDGENDIPALCAGFGISIQSSCSSKVVEKESGVVLSSLDFQRIVTIFEVARQTVANIKSNIYFSLAYNFAAMFIASGYLLAWGISFNPVVGVSLMFVQSVILLYKTHIFNRQPLHSLPVCENTTARSSSIDSSYAHVCRVLSNTLKAICRDTTANIMRYEPPKRQKLPSCNTVITNHQSLNIKPL